VLLSLVLAVVRGCGGCASDPAAIPPPTDEERGDVLVTGYCSCGACCGWRRSWLGLGPPVYDYGAMKGRRKKVGVTARGTTARHGTVAADPRVFPFGTRLLIPGYGTGVVEDVGGAIKGRHIDAWFPSHEAALTWGRRSLKVVPIQ
jgi:3D (Asp-Asp-Asp) domain-containing protein